MAGTFFLFITHLSKMKEKLQRQLPEYNGHEAHDKHFLSTERFELFSEFILNSV